MCACWQVDSAMGAALQAAFMVMTPIGGKLLLFLAAVPSLGETCHVCAPACICWAVMRCGKPSHATECLGLSAAALAFVDCI